MNADAASWLAGYGVPEQTSTARTAGLISNLGLMWLAESLPTQTGEAIARTASEPSGALNAALAQRAGLGFDEAGALLADAWQLPAVLCDAIANQFNDQRNGTPLERIVSAAARMVGVARRDQDWQQSDPGLERLGIALNAQQTIIERLAATEDKTAELADALFLSI